MMDALITGFVEELKQKISSNGNERTSLGFDSNADGT